MKALKILAVLAAVVLTASMVMADDDAQEFIVVMENMARDGRGDAQPGRPDAPRPDAGHDGGWVGVALEPAGPVLLEQLGLKGGMVVAEVAPGGPADKAGVKKFDVIAVGGKDRPISVDEYVNTVRQFKPGSEMQLTVIRKGKEKYIELVVGTAPREMAGGRAEGREGRPDMRPEGRGEGRPDMRGEGRPEGRGGWGEMNREDRPGQMMGRPDMRGEGRGGMPGWGRPERPDTARIQIEAEQIKQEARHRQELLQKMTSDNPQVAAQARQQWKELNDRNPQAVGTVVGEGGMVIRFGEATVQGPADPHMTVIKSGVFTPMPGQPMMPGPGMAYPHTGMPAMPAMTVTPSITVSHATNDIRIDENGKIEVRIVRDGNSLTIQFKSEADLAARAPKLLEAYRKIMSAIR